MINNRNAWTRYYESTLPRTGRERRPRVVQSEKQAPLVLRGAEKQIAEDNAQFRRYNRAKAAEYRAALAGPDCNVVKQLHDALKHLDIDLGEALIALVSATDWQSIDTQTRYTVVSMIDDAIVRVREQAGLAPFDDSIFDEDPTVFEICRTKLRIV
jgi:hypothetical protein